MALLKEIITKTRQEVVGRIFSKSKSHHKDWKRGCGDFFFPKSSLDQRNQKGGCGENFFPKVG